MLLAIKKSPFLFLFAVITTIILSSLGNWQYQKGLNQESKKEIERSNLEQQTIDLNNVENNQNLQDGFKITVKGKFVDDKIIFHDNRLNLGKVGYHVYSIFKVENKESILVNRGWVQMNLDRRILPEVNTSTETVTITGIIRHPIEGVFTLKDETLNKTFPQRLQTINIDEIKNSSGIELKKYVVLLDDSTEGEHFIRQWSDLLPGKYMTADKHYAYSLQWYSLAVVGFVIFMLLIMKMARHEQK